MADGRQIRTPHFVLHQLQETTDAHTGPGLAKAPALILEKQLGVVVPKRLAKRAVTRNLIRRQVKEVLYSMQAQLPTALYVVRLRASFVSHGFVSAASDALKKTVRAELQRLMKPLRANG